MDSTMANHNGRAYQCLRCMHRGRQVIGRKQRIEDHIMANHLSLDQAPFYCTLCHFRSSTRHQLVNHVTKYKGHVRAIEQHGGQIDSSRHLMQNQTPYIIGESDYIIHTKENSARIFKDRAKEDKTPLDQILSNLFQDDEPDCEDPLSSRNAPSLIMANPALQSPPIGMVPVSLSPAQRYTAFPMASDSIHATQSNFSDSLFRPIAARGVVNTGSNSPASTLSSLIKTPPPPLASNLAGQGDQPDMRTWGPAGVPVPTSQPQIEPANQYRPTRMQTAVGPLEPQMLPDIQLPPIACILPGAVQPGRIRVTRDEAISRTTAPVSGQASVDLWATRTAAQKPGRPTVSHKAAPLRLPVEDRRSETPNKPTSEDEDILPQLLGTQDESLTKEEEYSVKEYLEKLGEQLTGAVNQNTKAVAELTKGIRELKDLVDIQKRRMDIMVMSIREIERRSARRTPFQRPFSPRRRRAASEETELDLQLRSTVSKPVRPRPRH